MSSIELITLNEGNIEGEHICCAISDKKNQSGVNLKKEWLKQRFKEGLVFKKFNVRGKAFIEYLPGENAWSPVDAHGYMFINCLWVAGSHKGKGLGSRLLEECIQDSVGKNGVVVLSSKTKKPFLSDKSFLKKKGFEVCDTAPPYFELLVKRFNSAPIPRFRDTAKQLHVENDEGLTVYYTDQCPFNHYYVNLLAELADKHNISFKRNRITCQEDARILPSAYSSYSIFYNGRFVTHEILSETRFNSLFSKQKLL